MELKDKLVSLRKRSGLSQAILAEKLKVSRQTVSNWELGEILPSTDNLARLSKVYGVSVDYLLNDDVEGPAAAVAVAERPEARTTEDFRRKPILTGVAIGFAIALILALLYLVFSIGYGKGTDDTTPTHPIHTDVIDEVEIEGTADLIGW